jgi:transposase
MAAKQKNPLRELTPQEREMLQKVSRSHSLPAEQVIRAGELLAVAQGKNYMEAAHLVGRKSNDAVSHLVSRFNQAGLSALETRPGGRPALQYGLVEKERIIREFQRPPQRTEDGTTTWSLVTLQRALRQAPDGLPQVSTYVIWQVLHEYGWSWQKERSWCGTGKVIRLRKAGPVEVSDPDGAAKKKSNRAGVHPARVSGVQRRRSRALFNRTLSS